MTNDTVGPAPSPAPSNLEVTDLDQFVKLLVGWHSNKVRMLEHMLQIPDDQTIEMEFEGQSLPLSGELRRGFMAGVNLALIELGTLPFGYELETPVEEAKPAGAA